MNPLSLHRTSSNLISVAYAGKPIGHIELYSNTFHTTNQYLRLHLEEHSCQWAAQLCSQLQEILGKPLQVVLSSKETELAAFLTAGGFVCKRKCYEIEGSAATFTGPSEPLRLKKTVLGQQEYGGCCQLLFDHYRKTHRDINPLTADYQTFSAGLPSKAFYEVTNGQILHTAFVEENEIAYLASKDIQGLYPFAAAVAAALLAEYEMVCFECDDCDAAAMILPGLFSGNPSESYDTYIFRKRSENELSNHDGG